METSARYFAYTSYQWNAPVFAFAAIMGVALSCSMMRAESGAGLTQGSVLAANADSSVTQLCIVEETESTNSPEQKPCNAALVTTQGRAVEFVATVSSAASGLGVPTGSVTFMRGSTVLGSAALDPTGIADFTETLLPVGNGTITATYSGDLTYAPSASAAVRVIVSRVAPQTYSNPLTLNASSSLKAVSCADPAIYKDSSGGVNTWYLYCTSDALYAGDPNPHYINIFQSSDLVNWNYVRNAFPGLPSWAMGSGGFLWAPAIKHFNGQFYLYYAASKTSLTGGGSAIGVGISSTPAGPFVDSGRPVVEPEKATTCCSGQNRSTIDPDEIQDATGQRYILFGSFTGGIFVRKLSADGLTSDPSSEQQIAADSRYEGGNWWFHDGYYYLFASASSCCNGPLSGYGVFAARASTPMGPYLDAQGIRMTATNVGGTPVLTMNGNSVIGPGGNVVFTDESGQDYILYHGIIATDPYYKNAVGYTARPAFNDALDWLNGWPVARGGFGPSDVNAPQPVPAAQPGSTNNYKTALAIEDLPRALLPAYSDDFSNTSLSSQWSFIHAQPAYMLSGHGYQVDTNGIAMLTQMPQMPMLAERAPPGDYMVETELSLTVPTSGSGYNFAQAGLLVYGSDANYVRADLVSSSDTRQVEFLKHETPVAPGYPNSGISNAGPPGFTTTVNAWLRIVKRNVDGQELYTAYSSSDGITWSRGGTWIHSLGSETKICLYAGSMAGFTATFSYVHVSALQ